MQRKAYTVVYHYLKTTIALKSSPQREKSNNMGIAENKDITRRNAGVVDVAALKDVHLA